MACCIAIAMLISEVILLCRKAREHLWLNVLAIGCFVAAASLLVWHWHHIEELILHPFSFTFISSMLNDAASYCRAVGYGDQRPN